MTTCLWISQNEVWQIVKLLHALWQLYDVEEVRNKPKTGFCRCPAIQLTKVFFEFHLWVSKKTTCSLTTELWFGQILITRHVFNEFWPDCGPLNTFPEYASKEVLEGCWHPRRLRIMFRNAKTRCLYHLLFYLATITSFRQPSSEGSAPTTPLCATKFQNRVELSKRCINLYWGNTHPSESIGDIHNLLKALNLGHTAWCKSIISANLITFSCFLVNHREGVL